jgi:uncharacterized protein (TIGR04255 family)
VTTVSALVNFDDPPVTEVALGIQFAPVPALTSPRGGRLWDAWAQDYPKVVEQPPLTPQPPIGQQGAWLQLGVAGSRMWFMDPSEDHVVQLQNDRLIVNWRRASGAPYPRFTEIRDRFKRSLDDVNAVTNEIIHRSIAVEQIELSYINVIDAAPKDALLGFRGLLGSHGDHAQMSANLTLDLAGQSWSNSVLAVSVNGGVGPKPVTNLTMTFRATPTDATDPLPAMNEGHDSVVGLFDEITPAAMHERWKKVP